MGKPKHSNDPRGDQKGAQVHEETEHGPKTREALKANISNDHRELETHSQREAHDPNRGGKRAGHDAEQHERMIANPDAQNDGRHPLFENRIQHDDAESDSEQNRRSRDIERHGHDRAQIQGETGSERSGEVTVKNAGHGGGNRAKADHGHS